MQWKAHNVAIRSQGNRGRVDPRTIRRRAGRALIAAGHPTAKLSLLLCDDAFIRALNREYRNRDSSTDVLSFSMNEGDNRNFDGELLGDVVVSVETAEKQAKQLGRSLTDEVTSLVIHGILHLLGRSHSTKQDAKEMFALAYRIEKEILSARFVPQSRSKTNSPS